MANLSDGDERRQGVADYLHVDQPKPLLWQGRQFKGQLRHDPPGSGGAMVAEPIGQQDVCENRHAEGAVTTVGSGEGSGDRLSREASGPVADSAGGPVDGDRQLWLRKWLSGGDGCQARPGQQRRRKIALAGSRVAPAAIG